MFKTCMLVGGALQLFLNTHTNTPGILWQEPDSEMILPLTCLSWRRGIIPAHINALKYNSADRLSKFKQNTIFANPEQTVWSESQSI